MYMKRYIRSILRNCKNNLVKTHQNLIELGMMQKIGLKMNKTHMPLTRNIGKNLKQSARLQVFDENSKYHNSIFILIIFMLY
jgi:hypothetical protein